MRKPNFSSDTVLSAAKNTLQIARENQEKMLVLGVTDTMLNQLASDIEIAESLPTELKNRFHLKDFTQSKDEILESCYIWGRLLRTRIRLAFGLNSKELKSFPADDFKTASQSEGVMKDVMGVLIDAAVIHKNKLAEFGQTDEVIKEGKDLLQALIDADKAQEMKKISKQEDTQTRHAVFRQIYDTVNNINRIGRILFENDPVKWVLFKSPWPFYGDGDDSGTGDLPA